MKRSCLLDMDGVLVALQPVIYAKHGITNGPDQMRWNNGELPIPEDVLWAGTDAEWWANLPWLPDGRQVLELCESLFDQVLICSKPARPDSAAGKMMWLSRHMPAYAKNYIFCTDKAEVARPDRVLVDDNDHNVLGFRAAGGQAVLVARPWNSAHLMVDSTLDFIKHDLAASLRQ